MAKVRQTEPLTEREQQILVPIRPFTSLLNAPGDLTGVHKVAEEFYEIVQLILPIAKSETHSELTRAVSAIAVIVDPFSDVARLIVQRASPSERDRKTLANYYGSHPHYSIYWERCKHPALVRQYRALIASLFLVNQKLGHSESQANDPYLATVARTLSMHLRLLVRDAKITGSVIESLPDRALRPEDLISSIDTILGTSPSNESARDEHQRLRYIKRALKWHKTGVWTAGEAGSRSGGKRSPRSSGRSTNAAKPEDRLAINLDNDFGDPFRISSFYPRPERKKKDQPSSGHGDGDDDQPSATNVQLQPRASTYAFANRRRLSLKNARYANQAIEQLNQQLPVTRSTLSGNELSCFLDAIEDTQTSVWDKISPRLRQETAAWSACRFYLSRSPKEIEQMVVSFERENIQPRQITWRPESNDLLLPVVGPAHIAPAASTTGDAQTVNVQPYFSLRCPTILATALKRLQKSAGRVFQNSREQQFKELAANLKGQHAVELNVAKIGTAIATLITQLAPNDSVAGHYFVGDQPNHYNPAVYSIVPITQLTALFEEACAIVDERSGRSSLQRNSQGSIMLSEDGHFHVGSLHVPRMDLMQSTIAELKRVISKIRGKPVANLAALHNSYTAYVTFFLLATSGMRAVSKLIPADFDLDETTGLCFVSDKDNSGYRHARVVWLHPAMVKQLAQYAEHVVRLRQHLALSNPYAIDRLDNRTQVAAMSPRLSPNRTKDLEDIAEVCPSIFMLKDPGCHIAPVSPTDLVLYLGDNWKLRLAALRHFIRSHFLRSGVSGEVTNALLGHFDRGQAPWGQFSTLSPSLWRRIVGKTLEPLIKRLGLVTLPSPLIGRNH